MRLQIVSMKNILPGFSKHMLWYMYMTIGIGLYDQVMSRASYKIFKFKEICHRQLILILSSLNIGHFHKYC